MKQITKSNKLASKTAVAVVEKFVSELNRDADMEGITSHFRWFSRTHIVANQYGELALVDLSDGSDYKLTVWEHKGETMVVPGFASDEGWCSYSTNGAFYYTVEDEKPVILED